MGGILSAWGVNGVGDAELGVVPPSPPPLLFPLQGSPCLTSR